MIGVLIPIAMDACAEGHRAHVLGRGEDASEVHLVERNTNFRLVFGNPTALLLLDVATDIVAHAAEDGIDEASLKVSIYCHHTIPLLASQAATENQTLQRSVLSTVDSPADEAEGAAADTGAIVSAASLQLLFELCELVREEGTKNARNAVLAAKQAEAGQQEQQQAFPEPGRDIWRPSCGSLLVVLGLC